MCQKHSERSDEDGGHANETFDAYQILVNCLSESLIPKGMQVNLKIHIGEDSNEIQGVVNKMLEKTLLEITRVVRDEHQRRLVDYKPKMKELEKQLSQKVNGRDKISDIDAKIFQITEVKKNEILGKQNKKLSRLRTDRNKSVSVNNQTTESSKTTKTNSARDGRNKRKEPKRKNRQPTPITQNKQPESSANSTSTVENNENNKRQTENHRRNIADQDSPVIDLTKQTEKYLKKEMAIQKTTIPRQQPEKELCGSHKKGKPKGQSSDSNLQPNITSAKLPRNRRFVRIQSRIEWRKAKLKKATLQRGKETIVNLSSRSVTDDEFSLLGKWLKFYPKPKPRDVIKLAEGSFKFSRRIRLKVLFAPEQEDEEISDLNSETEVISSVKKKKKEQSSFVPPAGRDSSLNFYIEAITHEILQNTKKCRYHCDLKSKKISNDQELIQSDSTSCPQNPKGNN